VITDALEIRMLAEHRSGHLFPQLAPSREPHCTEARREQWKGSRERHYCIVGAIDGTKALRAIMVPSHNSPRRLRLLLLPNVGQGEWEMSIVMDIDRSLPRLLRLRPSKISFTIFVDAGDTGNLALKTYHHPSRDARLGCL
jgi:hypothetical protein